MNTDWTDSLAALRATLPGADEPADDGQTAEEASDTSATGNRQLTLCYERKQRRGKPATIITGFDCSDEQLSEIASKIKKRLATGGSARGGEILVQGDRREEIRTLLADMGYKVKG
ncbi:translation initiation factor [Paramuribaculum intestinale]|uniref:translation initiation factor n=1 Tax=Paramuribaculum intestinale TaxID=2094151 RepID=UPI0025B2601B|nr:translation initiation factor [Paramuribaculum intestinale]